MSLKSFSDDQLDALQETANIAMGQAGAVLARLLDHYVALSVPRAKPVQAADLAATVSAMLGPSLDLAVTAVRQSFQGRLRGEAISLFGTEGCSELADLLGHESGAGAEQQEELLLDVSNILVGAVLRGLGNQLHTDFAFSAPTLLGQEQGVAAILRRGPVDWVDALLLEVNFRLDPRNFSCHLVLLLPEESIDVLRQALDRMLGDI
ncbi:MAG: hypothetical protein JJU06_14815 [Ectothiorhodospiraceae bacterium]|nr:hypothetical protein [Ectothiorhodospiraceae bacterium]MCH8505477.1 hypothetical protein [Ectothiorhodospiraceae bacterium]